MIISTKYVWKEDNGAIERKDENGYYVLQIIENIDLLFTLENNNISYTLIKKNNISYTQMNYIFLINLFKNNFHHVENEYIFIFRTNLNVYTKYATYIYNTWYHLLQRLKIH